MLGSIDGGAHVLQRRARDVLLGSALFMVPMLGLGVLLSILAYDDFDRFDGLFTDRGYVGVESGLVFIAITLQSFTAHIVGAYGAHYLVQYQMGGEPRVRSTAWATFRKLPLLFVTWLLTHWWMLGLALLIVNARSDAASGWGTLAALVASVFTPLVLLVAPVVMAERLGLRSIGRAWRLVRGGRYGAAWSLVVLFTILAGSLLWFIAFLPSLLEQTGLITFGSWLSLVQGVMTQLAVLVVMPFAAVATAQFYLQLRVSAEGLDIVLAADRAFGERA